MTNMALGLQERQDKHRFSLHFIMYGHELRERASNAAVYRVQIFFFLF